MTHTSVCAAATPLFCTLLVLVIYPYPYPLRMRDIYIDCDYDADDDSSRPTHSDRSMHRIAMDVCMSRHMLCMHEWQPKTTATDDRYPNDLGVSDSIFVSCYFITGRVLVDLCQRQSSQRARA